jgi:hypothetical protein
MRMTESLVWTGLLSSRSTWWLMDGCFSLYSCMHACIHTYILISTKNGYAKLLLLHRQCLYFIWLPPMWWSQVGLAHPLPFHFTLLFYDLSSVSAKVISSLLVLTSNPNQLPPPFILRHAPPLLSRAPAHVNLHPLFWCEPQFLRIPGAF